jgi:uncharacterized protein YjiS (DUF1127 family)
MLERKIFIGDPYDPDFEWRGGEGRASVPRPVAPPLPGAARLWRLLAPRFHAGHLGARRSRSTDWVGLASRRELLRLVDDAFRDAPVERAEARRLVDALDDRTIYYLVAAVRRD